MRKTGIAINSAQPVNQTAPLNRGLVYWSMVTRLGGKTLFDLVKNTNGTLVGPPTWGDRNTRPGGYGHLSYAPGQHVDLPTTFQMPTNALTIGGWVYINNSLGIGFDSLVFRAEKAPNYHIFDFYPNYSGDGNGYFGWYNIDNSPPESRIAISNAALGLLANTWQHIVYTWTPGVNHSLYLNGVSKSSSAPTIDNSFNTSGATSISFGGSTGILTGAIDDFRIYNRQLSAAEVKSLYQASQLGYPNELNRIRRRRNITGTAAPAVTGGSFFSLLRR